MYIYTSYYSVRMQGKSKNSDKKVHVQKLNKCLIKNFFSEGNIHSEIFSHGLINGNKKYQFHGQKVEFVYLSQSGPSIDAFLLSLLEPHR